MVWLEKLLIAILWGLLERAASRAGKETKEYIDEQLALRENKKKSNDYESVVKKPDATREERRASENSTFDN